MKATLRTLSLLLLWMACFAGQSPEQARPSAEMRTPVQDPQPELPWPAAQVVPDQASLNSLATKSLPASSMQSAAPKTAGPASASEGKHASKKDHQGQHWTWAALLGTLSLGLGFRRRIGSRLQKWKLRSRKPQRPQLKKGIGIFFSILVGLILFTGTLLLAFDALKIAWSFSMIAWMSLGVLTALVAILVLAFVIAAIFEATEIDLGFSFDESVIAILLFILIGIPILIGLGALIFWLFLNLFMPITIGYFAAGAVMGIVFPGIFAALAAGAIFTSL